MKLQEERDDDLLVAAIKCHQEDKNSASVQLPCDADKSYEIAFLHGYSAPPFLGTYFMYLYLDLQEC